MPYQTETASQLLYVATQIAPAQYKTVARLHEQVGSGDEAELPYIAADDLTDGFARVEGHVDAVGMEVNGKLPALLIHEIGQGFGVIVTVWHRDDSFHAESRGSRYSCRTINQVVKLHNDTMKLLEDAPEIDLTQTPGIMYSYTNVYGAFACYSTYRLRICKFPQDFKPFQGLVPNIY